MEGDVEFNDEDDVVNPGVITRRLNLTTGATGNFQSSYNNSQLNISQNIAKDKKVYGEKARKLFLKCFQYILRQQVAWLIRDENFPEDFEFAVKTIWMEHLKLTDKDNDETNDYFSNGETDVTPYNTTQEDDSDMETTERRRSTIQRIKKLKLSINSAISILYLAAVHLGHPAYISDFITYICTTTFPYYKANLMLPKSWRDKLPNYYLGLLSGKHFPKDGQLINKIIFTSTMIHFPKKFHFQINGNILLLRLLIASKLTPEFYFFTRNMIRLLDDQETFSLFEFNNTTFTAYYKFPEIRTICFFILSIRWKLMCDGVTTSRLHYPSEWIDSLINGQEPTDDGEKASGLDIKKLFYPSLDDQNSIDESGIDQSDPYNWNEIETSSFLDWVDKIYLGADNRLTDTSAENEHLTIDQKIAKRKLEKIIPLDSTLFPQTNEVPQPLTILEQLQGSSVMLLKSKDITKSTDDSRKENRSRRFELISRLEKKLINEFSSQCGFSDIKLNIAINRIERHCINTIRHK
ncbi:Pol I core factor CF [Maudiozyma exigua]|uniref:Pol I core factor CF n=1 Tax=Maudiozyma exigua TaxID=34358 RepID=A0A9P6VV55_MAUEX|nr:Pol I core factor CF [Kazachstania exigua]